MSCQSTLLADSLCAWSFCVLVSMMAYCASSIRFAWRMVCSSSSLMCSSYGDDFFLVIEVIDGVCVVELVGAV